MLKNKKFLIIIAIILILVIVAGGLFYVFRNFKIEKDASGKLIIKSANLKDDWNYKGSSKSNETSSGISKSISNGMVMNVTDATSESATSNKNSTIGLSTGGAKNVENFRENIKNGYFPISTDITYNGLFYDYYFDTGRKTESTELFSPSYSMAKSKDPISGETEYYMTVGLNSNIKQSDFKRKKLNIVVMLDISGSMSSSLKEYYYDSYVNVNNKDKDYKKESKSKMKVANESVNLLLDKLNNEDRVGMVLFETKSYVAKPLNLVGETDIDAIKEHVLDIKPLGNTNFSAGYEDSTNLFSKEMLNDSEYENRIIVITDAMPNLGTVSKGGLAESIKENADKGIYTSFIGVGVDFNTQVIECLSDVKGANYYSVHSTEEFHKIMSEDFEYMVTPLVFDLELKLKSNGFSIANVYGTDTKNNEPGTLMKVNTLFPSSSNSSGENKGGVILVKLKSNFTCGTNLQEEMQNENIKLTVSYKDRDGESHSNSQNVKFGNNISEDEYYENTGIRKAILLTRYANLMKNWILYERSEEDNRFLINTETGIVDCCCPTTEDVCVVLGENERTSVKLTVGNEYKELFKKMKKYMESEVSVIGDDELKQEIEILEKLI